MNIQDFVAGIRPLNSSAEPGNVEFPINNDEIWARLAFLRSVPRMSSWAIGGIINYITTTLSSSSYLNVGVWHGYTLFAGMVGNPYHSCIGVDNFSQFGGPEDQFRELFRAIATKRHEFHKEDYRQYLRRHSGKVGFYLYDGPHDYQDQLDAMELVLPHMTRDGAILVDDTVWPEPRMAVLDFQRAHPEFRLLAHKVPKQESDPHWWNGIMLLQRTL